MASSGAHDGVSVEGMTKKTKPDARTAKSAGKKVSSARRAPPGKKKSAPSVLARSAAIAVAANRTKGEDALALIRRRVAQIAESFYDIALALHVLKRKEVYAALGAPSFDALVVARMPISRTLAFELLKIPTHLSREAAVQLGREKAVALIRHVEHTPEDDSAEALVRGDAKVAGKPLSRQTAAAIEEEVTALRRKSGKTAATRPGEAEADAIAGTLEKNLELVTDADVRVVPVRRKDGWWLRLDVPVALGAKLRAGAAGRRPRSE